MVLSVALMRMVALGLRVSHELELQRKSFIQNKMKEKEDRYFGKDFPGTEEMRIIPKDCGGMGGVAHEERGAMTATQREHMRSEQE